MNNIRQRNILLAISSFICICILIGRYFLSGTTGYTFLVWNLFLAWIPLFFSQELKKGGSNLLTGKAITLFIAWLAFFPNAPYIVTDLFHLVPKYKVPLWYDLILIVSFDWNGMLIGFVSLMEVHQTLLQRFSIKISWTLIGSISLLSGYGIYLGRFERLNSWEIVTHPFRLFKHLIENFQDPNELPRILGVTLTFGLFLMISYVSIYFLSAKNEARN